MLLALTVASLSRAPTSTAPSSISRYLGVISPGNEQMPCNFNWKLDSLSLSLSLYIYIYIYILTELRNQSTSKFMTGQSVKHWISPGLQNYSKGPCVMMRTVSAHSYWLKIVHAPEPRSTRAILKMLSRALNWLCVRTNSYGVIKRFAVINLHRAWRLLACVISPKG